jgi:hypothetical protein
LVSRPSIPTTNLIRPTANTRFHIDYDWWERSGQELRLYLLQHLCEEHRHEFALDTRDELVFDWVDPETGRVVRVNRLMYALHSHCSRLPEYVTERTALVDAVFRILLASGNQPMTAQELAQRTGRAADMIQRTLSGKTVYKGLRPISGD